MPHRFARLSVLIIEDDAQWIKILQLFLERHHHNITGIATNKEEAIELLERKDYDIVFLDLNLHGQNSGLDLAQIINDVYSKPFLIISANETEEVFSHSIAAKPAAYLLKPFHETSLVVALNSIQGQLREQHRVGKSHQSLYVKVGKLKKKLEWDNVGCLSIEKNYTKISLLADKQTHLVRGTLLNTWAKLVPDAIKNDFFQVNRSEIVRISTIEEVLENVVKTSHGTYKVSNSLVRALKEKLH